MYISAKLYILLFLATYSFTVADSLSLKKEGFKENVLPYCFRQNAYDNTEVVLGQTEPVGISIENLISFIERMELKYPDWKPEKILSVLLQRFHYDGLHNVDGTNEQSRVEFKHSLLTESILSDKTDNTAFPENEIFSQDEKCNIFFTLSHTINKTALINEPIENTKVVQPRSKMSKSQAIIKPKEEKKVKETTTLGSVQAGFLPSGKNKRETNSDRAVRESKTPREYGVASFLSNKVSAVAVNRLLLGLFVGFAQPRTKSMSEVLRKLSEPHKLNPDVMDENMNLLIAVTLGDFIAMDGEDFNKVNEEIFGAEGEWNTTTCQVAYVLKTTGNWGTMAEFRGGLDGYNIGYGLSDFIKVHPQVTASQALRFYYSKYGFSATTSICNRNFNLGSSLKDELIQEAKKYAKLWNALHYSNQHTNTRIDAHIEGIKETVFDKLNKAAMLSDDEKNLCSNQPPADIQSRPCETTADMFFLLDNRHRCLDKTGYCKPGDVVSSLTKGLPFGRFAGSLNVLYNAKSVTNPNLIDDDQKQITTSLFATVYNSTSNQCASCKALYLDASDRVTISDRNSLLDSINSVLEEFEEGRATQTGVPAKVFVWLDSGSLGPIPTDKIQQVQYERLKRQLLSVQRDVTFFGIANNQTNLKDIVTNVDYLVTIDDLYGNANALVTLRNKVCEAPSVFQYNYIMSNNCSQTSNNIVYQGFITPGFKQYWSMQPDSFTRSSRIELSFQADNGQIEVCYDRAIKPESIKGNCKKADKVGGFLTWSVPNPCPHSFEKCQPLFFTVTVDDTKLGYCTDKRCLAANQLSWSFNHTGVRCNSSYQLTSSVAIIFIIASTILSILANKNFL